jgi:hypothetical protein
MKEGPRSREQRTPPSEPTTKAQRSITWGIYVVIALVLLAVLVAFFVVCSPTGGGGRG